MANQFGLFLENYLAGGMGAMSKRDIDALIMFLLDEYGSGDGHALKTLSNQQMSVKLRTSVARIRTLRYEAALKYQTQVNHFAQWKFLEVIARAQFDADKQKVVFIVEDMFTRHWLQGELKRKGFVFDTSFNTEIVKVDVDALCSVLVALYEKKSADTLKKRMSDAVAKGAEIDFAEIKKEFLKGAAAGLGEAAGSNTVKALLALVGMSEVA